MKRIKEGASFFWDSYILSDKVATTLNIRALMAYPVNVILQNVSVEKNFLTNKGQTLIGYVLVYCSDSLV